MGERLRWVLLMYRLPRSPSTARVALWRKLRRLGVVQVTDGVVGLPADARSEEQLGWLVDEVAEAGGQAWLWLAEAASSTQERQLVDALSEAVAQEYRTVVAEARAAGGEAPAVQRRVFARLSREMHRIETRDYFPPSERERAEAALARLGRRAAAVGAAVGR